MRLLLMLTCAWSAAGLFGAASSAAASPFTFSSQPASTPSLFGAQPASTPSLFGAASTPSLFGAQPAAASTPSLFGAQPASAPSLFGAASTPSLFGAQPAASAPSLFGAASAPAGGLFGQAAPAAAAALPFAGAAPQAPDLSAIRELESIKDSYVPGPANQRYRFQHLVGARPWQGRGLCECSFASAAPAPAISHVHAYPDACSPGTCIMACAACLSALLDAMHVGLAELAHHCGLRGACACCTVLAECGQQPCGGYFRRLAACYWLLFDLPDW